MLIGEIRLRDLSDPRFNNRGGIVAVQRHREALRSPPEI